MARPKIKAAFIEPVLLLRTEKLPVGRDWLYEIKLDGYRASHKNRRQSSAPLVQR
jgi:ATP-dependent DNA ligase